MLIGRWDCMELRKGVFEPYPVKIVDAEMPEEPYIAKMNPTEALQLAASLVETVGMNCTVEPVE